MSQVQILSTNVVKSKWKEEEEAKEIAEIKAANLSLMQWKEINQDPIKNQN